MRKEFAKAFGADIRHKVDIDNRVVVCKIRPSKDIFRLLNRFRRIAPDDFSTVKSGGDRYCKPFFAPRLLTPKQSKRP